MKPYPEQIEAAKVAAKTGRGIVCMPTGLGKGLTMALLVNELQVRTLIVVPNLALKTQLTASFKAWFGDLTNITIENIDSKALQKASNYDCLICDEAHHAAASTYRKLNKTAWKGIYYRFFFTATPFRSRDEEAMLLESVAGRVIYRVTHETAVAKGYIAPLQAFFLRLPKQKLACNGRVFAGVYNELVVKREDRNKIIAHLAANLIAAGVPTLILVRQIEHGAVLQQLLLDEGLDIAFAKGENEDNRQLVLEYNLGERIGLIGTSQVLGEGVDVKPAEFCFLAGLGKSKNAFMQQCGRVLRRYEGKDAGKIVTFYDPSHKWVAEHFKAQVKYLRDEYGVEIEELPLPEGWE